MLQNVASNRGDADLALDLRAHALRIGPNPAGYTPLLGLVGNARFALLGEASHGTHEFYRERAEITKRLILEKGYGAIAAEADWPDAYRVNRYVRGLCPDESANAALSGFKRFPAWMWRNTVMLEFVQWLRAHNKGRSFDEQVGFYGLDLYSLFTSVRAVLDYLDKVDPEAAQRARFRYACFDHYGEDTQAYGYAATFGMAKTCEDEVIAQLVDLTAQAARYRRGAAPANHDEYFYAAQNARLVKNAEQYYRTMFKGRVSSWNVRDSHMVETLRELDKNLAERGATPRIAVWAHNSHLGDARATEMGDSGEWNVGQLMREHYGEDVVLIGFSTYHGTVTAASDWDGPAETKRVRAGLPGSYEALFHALGRERTMLLLKDNAQLATLLEKPRLQRAIGVIYLPETERVSHYFHTRLPRQFDAMIHLDETHALQPLGARSEPAEEAETYPSGL